MERLLFFWSVAFGLLLTLTLFVCLFPAVATHEGNEKHQEDLKSPFQEKCADCHADEIAYQEWHTSCLLYTSDAADE